jgi:hypothetical protein
MVYDPEISRRKRREQLQEYVYRRPQEAINELFHSHFCRACGEDYECILEQCDLAPQTLCHTCYYKLEEDEI